MHHFSPAVISCYQIFISVKQWGKLCKYPGDDFIKQMYTVSRYWRRLIQDRWGGDSPWGRKQQWDDERKLKFNVPCGENGSLQLGEKTQTKSNRWKCHKSTKEKVVWIEDESILSRLTITSSFKKVNYFWGFGLRGQINEKFCHQKLQRTKLKPYRLDGKSVRTRRRICHLKAITKKQTQLPETNKSSFSHLFPKELTYSTSST